MAKKPCKFAFLRDWLDHGHAINLECVASRSGMSMTVYLRGERLFSVGGCGFDRIGTAVGQVLEALYPFELTQALERDPARELCSPGWNYCKTDAGESVYGATMRPDGSIGLDGACGLESMRLIAGLLGLAVTTDTTRSGCLVTIEKGR